MDLAGSAQNFSSRDFISFVSSLGAPICRAIKTSDNPVAQGGFGDIWKGRVQDGNTVVAIKVLRGSFSYDVLSKVYKRIASEVKIWQRFDHPNVLPFLGLCPQIEQKRIWLVSPWMEQGNLRTYLEDNPHADRVALIRQLVEAAQYLHENGIVHGDIKAANVLVGNSGEAVLADFGMSRVMSGLAIPEETTSSMFQGSVRWMAPERLDPSRFGLSSSGAHTRESDIYSIGMTIYEVMSLKQPFHDLTNSFTVPSAILNGRRPAHPGDEAKRNGLSNRLWAFVGCCWDPVPAMRPKLDQALETVLKAASAVSIGALYATATRDYAALHWTEIDLWKYRIMHVVERQDVWSYGRNCLGHWGFFPSEGVPWLEGNPIGGTWNDVGPEDERNNRKVLPPIFNFGFPSTLLDHQMDRQDLQRHLSSAWKYSPPLDVAPRRTVDDIHNRGLAASRLISAHLGPGHIPRDTD